MSSINLLIVYGIRKNCHRSGRNLLLHLFEKGEIKQSVVITEEYYCYQLHTKLYPGFLSQDSLHM